MKNVILTFSLTALCFMSIALYSIITGRIELQARQYEPIHTRTLALP